MTRRVAGGRRENVCCGLTEDECKGSVCAVSVCVDCLRGGLPVGEGERGRESPLPARRWNNSFLSKTREVVFVLVQLLNVQCIM